MWTTCKGQPCVIGWPASKRAHDKDAWITSPTYWRRPWVRLVPSILLISAHSTFFSLTAFFSSCVMHGNSQRPASKPAKRKNLIHYLLQRSRTMWPTTNRTFAWPLREQELLLSPLSLSDHHTGHTSLCSGRLLCWFSGEVLNTQVVVPGFWKTERACPAAHWWSGEDGLLNNRTGFNQSWHHLQQSSMSGGAEDFLSSFPISFMEFFSCLKCACTFIHMVQNTISDPKYSYLLYEVAC